MSKQKKRKGDSERERPHKKDWDLEKWKNHDAMIVSFSSVFSYFFIAILSTEPEIIWRHCHNNNDNNNRTIVNWFNFISDFIIICWSIVSKWNRTSGGCVFFLSIFTYSLACMRYLRSNSTSSRHNHAGYRHECHPFSVRIHLLRFLFVLSFVFRIVFVFFELVHSGCIIILHLPYCVHRKV